MKNIVIGSGPAGRLGSFELGKLGEDVTLIEKNHIAGTCLNEGCMVVCALTDITKFIDENKRFNGYGFLKSQLDISYAKIVEKINETQVMVRRINEMENESVGNNIIYGEASINGDNVVVGNESFEYDNLLIATGARPFIPDIPGSEYGLTNKDILKLDDVPEKLNIIGINEIYKNKVITNDNEELEGIAFFATSRTPNSEIAEGFVELNDDKSIKVNEMMQTNVENVYAAGDVTGGYQLTPVARMEGITAARNMANYANKVSYSCIPQTLSLNTEVSFVENEKANLSDDEKATIAMPAIGGPGSFWKILEENTGFAEIEFDKNRNRINKISSISPSSTSDVAYLSFLMRMDYDLDDYGEFLEIHPSTDTNYKIIKNMWL